MWFCFNCEEDMDELGGEGMLDFFEAKRLKDDYAEIYFSRIAWNLLDMFANSVIIASNRMQTLCSTTWNFITTFALFGIKSFCESNDIPIL